MRRRLLASLAILWLSLLAACARAGPTAPAPGVADTPAAPISAQVLPYDLGETTLLQSHFPDDSQFRHMPARLQGLIGVPAGDGPRPVVLILHGSHQICMVGEAWPCSADGEQPNYAGFRYLVDALAKAGYVALAIDVNAEYTFGFGEAPPTVRTLQLIDTHLGALAAANQGDSDRFGVDLGGRLDLSRMVWMGHSRGGDYVNWIVRQQNLATQASTRGYGPVQGLVLIAPSVFSTDVLPAADLPMAVILPACDSDVILLDGQRYYESARFDRGRTTIVTSFYLEGATHEGFNARLPAGAILTDRPDCALGAALSPEAQQDFLARYTTGFVDWLFGPPSQQDQVRKDLGLDHAAPVPAHLFDRSVQLAVAFPPSDRMSIVVPESEAELGTNLLGGEVLTDGVGTVYCPQGYYTPESEPGREPCRRVVLNQPGWPQQLVLHWDALDAVWQASLPASAGDMRSFTSLSLRAALDPLSDLNPQGDGQAFSVMLSDASGGQAKVIVSDLPYPPGTRIQSDFFEGETFSGSVFMKTVTLPLSSFHEVDLSRITEVALAFDQSASGQLFLADLEFIR